MQIFNNFKKLAMKKIFLILSLTINILPILISQQTVGEYVNLQFESVHPNNVGTRSGEIVWSQEIHYTATEASYLAVHFQDFNIAEFDTLVFRSPDYSRVWIYTSNYNDRGEFWSIPIYGNKIVIEIISSSQVSSFGYFIDEIARGFTTEELGLLYEDGICGNMDNSEEAKCFEITEPTIYGKSKAVARLWLAGTINCTGFLFGDEGHLMTCNHCIANDWWAENISIEMMAEGADCNTDCQYNEACPGVIVADKTTFVQTNCPLDYTVVLPDYNENWNPNEYGFLTLKMTGPELNEKIYLPQHPRGNGKRIAFYSDHSLDIDGFCHIHSFTEGPCHCQGLVQIERVGYSADAKPASSGSPVISYDDHCVVAVHGCGGCSNCENCLNGGVNSSLILQDLNYIPNNSMCGEFDCGIGDDISFKNENVIYDTYDLIPGNIYIQENATVTVEGKLEFGEGKSVIVENGGQLIIDGGWLTNCFYAVEFWDGIQVHEGGELKIFNGGKITDANIAIHCLSGSIIDIYDVENEIACEIDNVGLGIKVENHDEFTCYNTSISNASVGIHSLNSSVFFDKIDVDISEFGVFLDKSDGYIFESVFRNVDNSIVALKSHGSWIAWNDHIGFNKNGIFLWQSDNVVIEGNTIGPEGFCGDMGINANWSNRLNIKENPRINGKKSGVVGYSLTDAFIWDNTFYDLPTASNNKAEVQLTYGKNCVIEDNIFNSDYGARCIESVKCDTTTMYDNDLYVNGTLELLRLAAIRSLGSTGDIIQENELYCNPAVSGIIASNSDDNKYICNKIYDSDYGLLVSYNSDGQDIRGNLFDGTKIDLGIRSQIGPQFQAGNDFLGLTESVVAKGLNDFELFNSRFEVDNTEIEHWPNNIDPPTGWFMHDDGDGFDCINSSPSEIPVFFSDSTQLCKYYARLKEQKDSLPNKFFVNIFHLLKYEQINDGYSLPDCIKSDSLILSLCGLMELVKIDDGIRKLNGDNKETLILSLNNIDELRDEYKQTEGINEKATLLSELQDSIKTIFPLLEVKKIQDSLHLDSLKIDLERIDCNEYIVQLWVDILKIYIDYLQTKDVVETDRNTLSEYGKLCADEYGDYIHMARSLIYLFDSTYYDAYDVCKEEVNIRGSTTTMTKKLEVSVIPNPNNGQFRVQFNKVCSGSFFINDVTGQEIVRRDFENLDQIEISSLLKKGVFFFQVSTNKGLKGAVKFVVSD